MLSWHVRCNAPLQPLVLDATSNALMCIDSDDKTM